MADIYLGSTNLSTSTLYMGGTTAAAAYLGGTQVWTGVLPPWTPADISTWGWYDGSDVSTITLNGSKVSAIADKSGNANNLSQGNATYQPVYATGLVNGLNTLEYGVDGSASRGFAYFEAQILGNGLVGTKYAVIASYARYNGNGLNHLIGAVPGTSNGNLHMGYDSNTALRISQFSNDTQVSVPSYSSTVDEIVTGVNNSFTGKTIRLNGGAYQNSRTDFNNLVSNSGFSIAKFVNTTFLFAGRINEMVFINYDLDDATRDKIEGYLAWKWGTQGSLPAGHPYKNAAPTA